jgi:hypothetical protein
MSFLAPDSNRSPRFAAILATLAAALPLLPAQAGSPPAAAQSEPSQQILRSIDDPAFGVRWLLVSDPNHPGGPGRLVLADLPGHSATPHDIHPDPLAMVIRAGDSLTLEDHSGTTDTWLDAVALGPARAGASFLARLTFDGSIVRVVANAPGRATLVGQAKGDSKRWVQ